MSARRRFGEVPFGPSKSRRGFIPAGQVHVEHANGQPVEVRVMVATEAQYLVLNAIVLKKTATVDAIGHATRLGESDVEAQVEALAADGIVARIGSQVMPMDGAQAVVRQYTASQYPELGQDPSLQRWLTRFESLNGRFLQTITEWQQIAVGDATVTNDHSDADYDNRVLSRLDAIIDMMLNLIGQIGDRVPRLALYRARLDDAMARAAAGEPEYVSSPSVDSVHNIWFEFHEDILTLFGKQRSE